MDIVAVAAAATRKRSNVVLDGDVVVGEREKRKGLFGFTHSLWQAAPFSYRMP
jgi:hypothetical protein